MAEEVKIVDVAGGPAAEATLQEILKLMRQRGGGGSGGSGDKAATKAQELYTTAVNRGTTARKENTTAVKESTSAFKSVASLAGGALGGAFSVLTTVLGGAIGVFTNLGNAVANATSVGEFLEAVPVFGSLLSKASGYFDRSLDTFRQLSEVGAGFGNDMVAMRRASAEAGLSLEQFASVIANNSSTMGYLGGTTSDGAARFGKLSKALRSADAGLLALGYTQESVNEGLADYLENQALAGRLQGRSNAELVSGAQNYLTELDKLARVTGKSRKELAAEMNKNAAEANVAALRARLSGQGLLNFDANLTHLTEMLPGMGDAFKDLSDGVAQTPMAKVLASTFPAFKELAELNATGAISQEEFQNRLRAMTPQMVDYIKSMDPAQVQQLMGREGFEGLMNSVGEMTTYTQRQTDAAAAAAAQQRRSKLTEFFANFGQTIQDIRSKIELALIQSGVIDTLGSLLTGTSSVLLEVASAITEHFINFVQSGEFEATIRGLGTWITETSDKLVKWVGYLRSDEFGKKVDAFIESIKSAWTSVSNFVTQVEKVGFAQAIANALGAKNGETLGDVVKNKIMEGLSGIDWSGIALTIGGGLLALFAGAKVIGFMKDGIAGMFGGLFGGASKAAGRGGPPGSGGGGGAARAGKGVGDFVGQVGGGVLSGIAAGLKAFANPQVAIGGAVLAGVILVIGAAVAGATWLVGKSLPTFAEGMQSFEDLDGAKLSAAGKGMLAVAGGMAAFGAGSAVAGLGNLVGNIADGIGSLFGAEKANPLEQLLEFQKYTIDEAKVTGNANALVAYSKAMAAFGAGDAASGLGSLVGGLADGITSFFGGETGIPYDDIIAFQQYTFDAEKVRANAAAMVAFNNALTSSSAANATSGVGNAIGAIGNAISSFFGGETPFDQVKNFGALDINAEGVATNATAMVNMANALNAFNGGESGEIDIPQKTVTSLTRLGEIGGAAGINTLATNLQAVADVTGLNTNITSLNSLDATTVSSYNSAMEDLVDTLEKLNDVLAEDNKGTFGGGTGVSAGSMISNGQLNVAGSGSGSGSSDQLNQLNTLMQMLIEINEKIEVNTKQTSRRMSGDLQVGF